MTRTRLHPFWIAVFIALQLLLGSGCSSVDYRARFDQELILSDGKLRSGDNAGAAQAAGALIAQIDKQKRGDHLDQRLRAMFVLADANVRAAAGQPFLREVAYRSDVFQFGESLKAEPSKLAHLVAAVYYAGQMIEAAKALESATLPAGPLPQSLVRVDPKFVLRYCRYVGAASMAACGFEEQANALLTQGSRAKDAFLDETLHQTLEELGMPESLKAIDYFLAFMSTREQRPPEVPYRLGIRARMAMAESSAEDWAIVNHYDNQFESWYSELVKNEGAFISPTYATPYRRGLLACPEDATPVLDFVFRPKP